MNRGIETRQILNQMASAAGPEGMNLAHSLKHGFVGIARGIHGHACIAYLADQTLKGVLRVENNSWVYNDACGTRVVGGTLGDKVIGGIARIGVILHKSPEAVILDKYEISDGLADTARRVTFELAWRNRYYSVPQDPLLRQTV